MLTYGLKGEGAEVKTNPGSGFGVIQVIVFGSIIAQSHWKLR